MFHMDIGARNPEDVAALGIKTGDFVTIPKQYHKLLGRRAAARAFDDRVGCTALIAATWALGPDAQGRDLTFIWSTSEELGLEGAAAAAKHLAADGRAPNHVFAVDTFVSADSPLESKRFGNALLGQRRGYRVNRGINARRAHAVNSRMVIAPDLLRLAATAAPSVPSQAPCHRRSPNSSRSRPILGSRSRISCRGITASIARARQVLGYDPSYTTLQALHEALGWLAANGQADLAGQPLPPWPAFRYGSAVQ